MPGEFGTIIEIDGILVSEDYITDDAVEIEDLSDIERRMEEPPHRVRYTIGPLYGEIRVSNAAGEDLSPDESSGRVYRYNLSPAGTYSVRIRAPEDLKVTVNGVQLGKKDREESTLGIFEELADRIDGEPYKTAVYSFDGH